MDNLIQQQENILSELKDARKEIKTDDYSMSIGELINLYKEGEIKLDPDFQRLFRWEDHQKTRFIESILIGIPVPEIFVAQQSDGTWYLVDGVQRLSTIFQLVGVLKDKKFGSLALTTCKYAPSLDTASWEDLPISTQREFKKSKIKINIILTENSDQAQYELFQRLNTGGTKLEDQEVRNCLILMIDRNFYKRLNELKKYPNFKDCLSLRRHKFDKEFHMELILRMYIGYQEEIDYSKYTKNGGSISNILFSDFISQETVNLIKKGGFGEFEDIFKRTFDKLDQVLKLKSFLKHNEEKGDFSGSFNVSAFEMISVGVASNIDTLEGLENADLEERIRSIYKEDKVKEFLAHGVKAIIRFKGLTTFSKKYFS